MAVVDGGGESVLELFSMKHLLKQIRQLRYCVFLIVLIMLSPLGCKLDAPMVFGEQCPPGVQHLEDTENPYIVLNSLKCYDRYFVVSVELLNPSSFNAEQCCKESSDENGKVWQCENSDSCSLKYDEGLSSSLKPDYLSCLNYRKSHWFEKKTQLTYSVSCDNEDNCNENTQQYAYCPEDYPNCSYSSERGFFCISDCSSPWLSCPDELSENQKGRRCIRPDINIWHCGAKGSCSEDSGDNYKGAICDNGMICENGVCVCPENYQKCGDICVDILHDSKNCGGCSEDNSDFICGSGQFCSNGQCTEDTCHANTCSLANCVNSSAQCGPECISCDGLLHAKKSSCLSDEGQCSVTECEEGFHISQDETFCEMNSSKKCASRTSSDVKNCSEVFPNSGETYCDRYGKCWLKTCQEGFARFNDNCLTEEDFCREEDNQVFINDECRCKIGYSPCYVERDGFMSVLKCVNLLTDKNNCGECSLSCFGEASCKQAQCQCDSGFDACLDEGDQKSTHCVNFQTDSNHCGACNHSCPDGATCKGGQCECATEFTSCYDASEKNLIGCTDLQTDSNHCGACNHSCPDGATCKEGQCECATDLTSCYDASEKKNLIGCADLQTDSNHCGECNHACSEGFVCHEAQCVCETGHAECTDEGDADNILCVNLETDSKHCGECNHACSEGFICQESQCQCETGYTECSDESDETIKRCFDLLADDNHCGECNYSCPEGLTCQDGQCQ